MFLFPLFLLFIIAANFTLVCCTLLPPIHISLQTYTVIKSTIGIGDVDKELVNDLAQVGKGRCEIISGDDNMERIMSTILKWYARRAGGEEEGSCTN